MNLRRSRQRRTVAAGVAAVAAAGLVAATAATLGGITTRQLGADFGVVASCDTDGITAEWNPDFESQFPNYAVGELTLSGIADACIGQNLKVSLTGSGNVSLGEQVGPNSVQATETTVRFQTPVDAELIEGVSVTIFE